MGHSITDFQRAASRIEANPLGRLMYGQRELFHSNLLAWFFDELPDVANLCFRELAAHGPGETRAVEREKGNLDLVMHWPDRVPLVIENKVFSLPLSDQLKGYEDQTRSWRPEPSLVLLSMSAPQFETGPWRYLSYAELAHSIKSALPEDSTYEVQTMHRYADLILDLNDLISAVGINSSDEPVWLPDDLLSAITSSQMRAALQKARAQRLARHLDELLELVEPAWSAMSNATPLVEIFQRIPIDGAFARVGWQLQGSQFRRSVIYEDPALQGRDDASRRSREDVSRRYPELFTLPASIELQRSGRKEFNHFAPDSVYQYAKVPALTVGELVAAANEVRESITFLA